MTSDYFFVSFKLCPDVGNDKYIVLCDFGGRSMSGFDAMFEQYRIALRREKLIGIVRTPIQYVTLHFRERRGVASLRHRNGAKITVPVCEQKPYPVWFRCLRKSYPYLPLCYFHLIFLNFILCTKFRKLIGW